MELTDATDPSPVAEAATAAQGTFLRSSPFPGGGGVAGGGWAASAAYGWILKTSEKGSMVYCKCCVDALTMFWDRGESATLNLEKLWGQRQLEHA
ncbi:hypothetical protein LTR09_004689 [Extremus antarcticus]|uniref:Uncharacterized protein n=1 Tax=Extremus antarcticus TaxID=702011 RepID=A0AAJ0DHX1_9PEZI|nr:hypothetical protein LTR09_004689 [Extremus antarcticus]